MKIEDLDFADDTGPTDPGAAQAAADLLEEIEVLQNSGDYDWASDTLEGIYETVKRSGRVSEGQRRAVANISGSRVANRHTGRMAPRWTRRYD